jgi:hypothetical protein
MSFDCSDYDPLTHPEYRIGGCAGCSFCRIYSDGDIICKLSYFITEMTVPGLDEENLICEGYEREQIMGVDLGCITCESYNLIKPVCKQGFKSRKLFIRIY